MKTLQHYRAILKLATLNNIHATRLRLAGWTFHVSKGSRGYCRYYNKTITIPKWAIDRTGDYIQYYLAHEMAHAMLEIPTRKRLIEPHGQEFMETFKRICPLHLQHHETAYKPRNAAAAGISKEPVIVLESLGDIDDSTEDTIDYSVDLFDL